VPTGRGDGRALRLGLAGTKIERSGKSRPKIQRVGTIFSSQKKRGDKEKKEDDTDKGVWEKAPKGRGRMKSKNKVPHSK